MRCPTWPLLVSTLFLAPAVLSPAVAVADPVDEKSDAGKRHFLVGVRLFQDKNYLGALAEFDASYQQHATAVALQNVAVCQKALFRYADAIATLERLNAQFGSALTEEDRRKSQEAIREMNALLGRLDITVVPDSALVSVDGIPLPRAAAAGPVKVAAGEHRIAAEAVGYARAEELVRVSSGERVQHVHLELKPLGAVIHVLGNDREAEIALDRVPVGWGEWRGSVPPGEHTLQVYKPGFKPFNATIKAEPGKTYEVDGNLGAGVQADTQGPSSAATKPAAASGPRSENLQEGFFVLAGLHLASVLGKVAAQSPDSRPLGGLAVRGGYRWPSWALEITLDSGKAQPESCAGEGCNQALQMTHVGAAGRLFTNGEKGRFYGALGTGVAVQTLGDARSTGSYLGIEGGYQLNVHHLLLEGGLFLSGESSKNTVDKGLGLAGVAIRAGYSRW